MKKLANFVLTAALVVVMVTFTVVFVSAKENFNESGQSPGNSTPFNITAFVDDSEDGGKGGFTLSDGNWWIIAVGGVVIVGGVAALVIAKKKK